MVCSSSYRTANQRHYEAPQLNICGSASRRRRDKQVVPRGSRFRRNTTSSSSAMVSYVGRSRDRVTCCVHGKPCSLVKKHHLANRDGLNALTTAVSCKKSFPTVSGTSDADVKEYMGYESFHSLNNRKALLPGDDEYEYEPINPMPNKTKEKKREADTKYEVVERFTDYAEQPPLKSQPSSARRHGDMPPHRRVSLANLINVCSDEEDVSSDDGSLSTRGSTDYYLNWYLGERTRTQAERLCRKRSSFLLYHRYPSFRGGKTYEHVPSILPLFIVYRASNGEYFHYRVINRSAAEWPTSVKVDIPGEPYFSRLSALIYYYRTYSIAHGGNGGVDCFAWWKTNKRDCQPFAAIYDEQPTVRKLTPVMEFRKKHRDV